MSKHSTIKSTILHLLLSTLIIFGGLIKANQASCFTNSPYHIKKFINIDTTSHNSPCLYSGLINIQNNIKVHFVLIKSKISEYIQTHQSKSLLIWLNKPGQSFFPILFNSASPFKIETEEETIKTTAERLNEEFKIYLDSNYNINTVSDILFIDYPGNVGFSQGVNDLNLTEINSGFVTFIKQFIHLDFVSLDKTEVFFLGYSWLSPYFANEINKDEILNKRLKITKVGLFNTKTNLKYESDYKLEFLRALGILSIKDLAEYHNLEYSCDYNKNTFKNFFLCFKLNSYIEKISGGIDIENVKNSVYMSHGHSSHYSLLMSKGLNQTEAKKSLNIIQNDSSDSSDIFYRGIDLNLIEKSENYNRNHENNGVTSKNNFSKDFHIYYLTGQYDLNNSGINYIDNLISSLKYEPLGYYKVPSDKYKGYYVEYPDNTNIIKGYIKQNKDYTYIMFKDAGKNIAFDDEPAFSFFLNNYFLKKTHSATSYFNNIYKINHDMKDDLNKSLVTTNAIECPDNLYINKKDNPNQTDDISDQKNNLSSVNTNSKYNNQEKIIEEYGGCRFTSELAKSFSSCNNNGYFEEKTGICSCYKDYYGVDCKIKSRALNKFTKSNLLPQELQVFIPESNFDFIISNNLLFELESSNRNVVVSIMKKNEIHLYNQNKHMYFQRLEKKETVFYLEKRALDDIAVVVYNKDDKEKASIIFNIFNYNTKNSEFFGPGGIGFIVSLILFCAGIALYSSVAVLYKDYKFGYEMGKNVIQDLIIRDSSLFGLKGKLLDDDNKTDFSTYKNNDFNNTSSNEDSINKHNIKKLDSILKNSLKNSSYNSEILLDNKNESHFNFRGSNTSEEGNNYTHNY